MSNHGAEMVKQRRIDHWQEVGWRICRGPCNKEFLPDYGVGCSQVHYCPRPECQEAKAAARKASILASNKRRVAGQYKYNRRAIRNTPRRPCRSMDLRGMQSAFCRARGGMIPRYKDHAPWLFCDDCQREYFQRYDVSMGDMVVETIGGSKTLVYL